MVIKVYIDNDIFTKIKGSCCPFFGWCWRIIYTHNCIMRTVPADYEDLKILHDLYHKINEEIEYRKKVKNKKEENIENAKNGLSLCEEKPDTGALSIVKEEV